MLRRAPPFDPSDPRSSTTHQPENMTCRTTIGGTMPDPHLYTAVMARWHEALAACPDHVERVVACLTARWEAEA